MKRRYFLAGLGGAMVGLAGCTGTADREPLASDDSTTGNSDGIDGSSFYQHVSLSQDDQTELIVTVSDELDVNEGNGGNVKADALVLLHDGAWQAERTPVYDKTEYRFSIPGDGAYTLVGTGAASDGGDFPTLFEFETILEFEVDLGRVRVDGVYYTRREEEV